MIFFIQSSAFGFGWYLIKNENLEIQDLYRIYSSLTFASMILGRNFSQLSDMKKAKDGARTAFRIIERKSKIDSLSDEGLRPNEIFGEIKFENVHFRYPNRPQIKILKGFNLTCNKGETTALVGPSGN
jgi:ATP-binding cassette subfamily B (MDR/TAP) protein 1